MTNTRSDRSEETGDFDTNAAEVCLDLNQEETDAKTSQEGSASTQESTSSTDVTRPSAEAISEHSDTLISFFKSFLRIVVAFVSGGFIGNYLTFQQDKFEKDQRAIEITLHLATYWETNLDAETRRKAKLIVENDERAILLKDFAREVNTLDIKNIRGKKETLALLELNSNAKDSAIINAVLSYHNALTKVLNTMEALASIKLHTESNIANEILDKGYKCNFIKRSNELKPFIETVRVKDPKVWQPIDEVKDKKWKDDTECHPK